MVVEKGAGNNGRDRVEEKNVSFLSAIYYAKLLLCKKILCRILKDLHF